MSNLATIRDRVESLLRDASNAIWTTADIDEALRSALDLYTAANPMSLWGMVTLASDTREISVSTLSGIYDVLQVWVPYTAVAPEYPPNNRTFEYWHDDVILYINEDYEPQSGDVARVRYLSPQTIEDLDSAAATTVPAVDEVVIIHGAAGLAAIARSIDIVEEVSLGTSDAPDLQIWGEAMVTQFHSMLDKIRSRLVEQTSNAMVSVFPPDRWSQKGSDWI